MATANHFTASPKKNSCIHLYTFFFLFSTRFWGALRKRRGRKEEKKNCCLLCLPFPLSGIKPHFEGECCHASHNRRSRGNKQGQIHQTEGVALQDGGGTLGVNQSWTAKLVLIQREKEGSEGRNSLDRVFCLVHKRVNRKSQSGERHIPCYMKV